MVRRLKKDVLKELPDKIRQRVEVDTNKKVTDRIYKLLNTLSNKD